MELAFLVGLIILAAAAGSGAGLDRRHQRHADVCRNLQVYRAANVMGPAIYFGQSGPQTIRVQIKEDGMSIDQIVLSADRYLTVSPGTLRNDTTIVVR